MVFHHQRLEATAELLRQAEEATRRPRIRRLVLANQVSRQTCHQVVLVLHRVSLRRPAHSLHRRPASAALASKDQPAHLDLRENRARMVKMEVRAPMACRVKMAKSLNQDRNPSPASSARPVQPAQPDPLDPRDHQVQREHRLSEPVTERKVTLACLARQDQVEDLDAKDLKELLEPRAKSTTHPDQQALLAALDQSALLARKDHQERTLDRTTANRDQRATREHLDLMAIRDRQGRRAKRVRPEKMVTVTTAPSRDFLPAIRSQHSMINMSLAHADTVIVQAFIFSTLFL